MRCREARRLVSLYLDSELDERTAFEVARHLRECAECARRFEAERRLEERLVQAVAPPVDPGAELWGRIEGRILRRPAHRWPVAAAAALLLLAGFSAWRMLRLGTEPSLAGSLARMHARVLDGSEAPQAQLTGPEDVRSFFAARLPFPVEVPHGLDVRGGRLCSLHGRRLALVFARDSGVDVSLFVVSRGVLDAFPADAAALASSEPWCHTADGVNVAISQCGGELVAVAGALPMDTLLAILQTRR